MARRNNIWRLSLTKIELDQLVPIYSAVRNTQVDAARITLSSTEYEYHTRCVTVQIYTKGSIRVELHSRLTKQNRKYDYTGIDHLLSCHHPQRTRLFDDGIFYIAPDDDCEVIDDTPMQGSLYERRNPPELTFVYHRAKADKIGSYQKLQNGEWMFEMNNGNSGFAPDFSSCIAAFWTQRSHQKKAINSVTS